MSSTVASSRALLPNPAHSQVTISFLKHRPTLQISLLHRHQHFCASRNIGTDPAARVLLPSGLCRCPPHPSLIHEPFQIWTLTFIFPTICLFFSSIARETTQESIPPTFRRRCSVWRGRGEGRVGRFFRRRRSDDEEVLCFADRSPRNLLESQAAFLMALLRTDPDSSSPTAEITVQGPESTITIILTLRSPDLVAALRHSSRLTKTSMVVL